MKISHEVPLSMLEESCSFNDYHYCLSHLNKESRQYRDFYKKMSEEGKVVYADNGCFELGKPINNDWLIRETLDIRPTHVIAPDFLDNKEKTLEATIDFKKKISETDYKGNIIYVVQGSTYEEFVECYNEMKKMMREGDMFALPFDIKCFYEEARRFSKTITQVYAYSRNILIDKMIEDRVIDYSIPVHLLGCSDPCEFLHYRGDKYSFIFSVDTSCPIVLSMFKERLPENGLGKEKLKLKIADNLDWKFDDDMKQLMYNNIEVFKRHYLGRV